MNRKWYLCGAVLATAAALVGCRGISRQSGDPGSDRPAKPLNGEQVADVQVALGRTVENRGEAQQAVALYTDAVRKDPKRADAWARLAVLADKEARFADAGECYRRALELQPDNPDLYCNLGYSLYLQERFEEAESALRRAVTLKPDHKRAYNNLGLVIARLGRTPDALECFRRAGCPKADVHSNLAYALMLNGDLVGARTQYESARAADPSSEVARKGLKRLDVLAARLPQLREGNPAGGTGVVPAGGPVAPPAAPVVRTAAGR